MATLFELGKVEVVRVKKSSPGGDYTHLSMGRGRILVNQSQFRLILGSGVRFG
ncbi:hypothetical protein ymoll0001_33910 [Yersinia mollaretii ATCC 43969]|uniref:Uncharacterized protein n=1 Tax=Yersinia mollaretii (strain ATCC 43969 / DSM 18520 / CIP 103324 / CNY 7263 / WAIP 204) TaxID=349967 RepID=A0ABM9YB55_YERMW|nr:hypothetical protein ymoll0001_33910 [Yersinia mollaretii ATCC 43969]